MEKIKVRESSSVLKKLAGGGLLAIAFLTTAIVAPQLFLITRDSLAFEYQFLLLVLLVAWPFPLLIPIARGRKVMVTPILSINEKSPYGKAEGLNVNSNVGPVVDTVGEIALDIMAQNAAQSKFMLCEEGIVLYPLGGPILHRWSKISSFTAHPKQNRFDIKVSGYISKFSFYCWNNFENVKKLLSERIAKN
jgi:hypothetical protein